MSCPESSHLHAVCREWAAVRAASTGGKTAVSINGGDLAIADVVAVALYGVSAQLTDDAAVRQRIAASVDYLAAELAAGKVIYGVNTGFGGSADTRTQDFSRLQSALVQHLNVGVLLPADKGQDSSVLATKADGRADVDLLLRSHALPTAIVRAMMLVRGNSLARGHSAVRVEVVESLLRLLAANMTPVVPLRGSISASGDLSTLSYVAGALEGNPDVYVRCSDERDGNVRYLSADEALKVAGLPPVRLQAKEGLGITNGTAPSCAAACLALHAANQLAVWTQLLTAMSTEALAGRAQNYDAFLSKVRPHGGQCEAAATIRAFLAGSRLSTPDDKAREKQAKPGDAAGLAQDRYALRTAPQWIGPQLEDLALATRQVAVELNATTDNPLVDIAGSRIHHGGNFQAMAVTSAMEKTLTALQNLGRLLYAQAAELVDGARNQGLPPNLSADDPSTSFLGKGFDVNMAAYQAELSHLCRPVSAHVQVAELANQAVNSMALVAARCALEAGELVALMAATHLFLVCQALDLRCLRQRFRAVAAKRLGGLFDEVFARCAGYDVDEVDHMREAITPQLLDRWDAHAHLDLKPRGEAATRDVAGILLEYHFTGPNVDERVSLPPGASLWRFQQEGAALLSNAYDETRRGFFSQLAPASEFLSSASCAVYEFVRLDLNIPFHRGLEDHPTLAAVNAAAEAAREEATMNGVGKDRSNGYTNGHTNGKSATETPALPGGKRNGTRILGTMAGEIYMALRDGRLFDRIAAFCEEQKPWQESEE